MSVRRRAVAIVEDDARLLASLVDLFESAGFAVLAFRAAEDVGAEALRGVDCLVSDIGLPGADGIALGRLAAALVPALPVILMTGRDDLAARRDAPARRTFRKPFDGLDLVAAVAAAIAARP